MFFDDVPSGLPLLRGIEYQIDLVSWAAISNQPAYKSNPDETKDLLGQVKEMMSKGYIRKSISSWVIIAVLLPKNNGC